MPIISCSSCRARFKVPITTIGKAIKCPRCKEEFKAVALHSAPRKGHGPGPIVYVAIIAGAVLIVLLIAAMKSRNEEPVSDGDIVQDDTPTKVPPKKPPAPELTPQEILAERAIKVLEALREDDHPLLPGWIEYSKLHHHRRDEGLEETAWSDLSTAEDYTKREEYIELLKGPLETREFARFSTIDDVNVLRIGSGRGKVEATLRNPLKETSQKVTMHLVTAAGAWKVYLIEREAVEGGPSATTASDETVGPVAPVTRRKNPEGKIETVELLPDTPNKVVRDIERAVSVLQDVSVTTKAGKARADLVKAGKPAIPYLLNALVPIDLQDPNDAQVATRIAGTLMELTGQDYPIVPGMNTGSMLGEGASENLVNMRKWFGWWRDHKGVFTGPPKPDFGPEEEVPAGRKRRRR